MTKEKVLRHSRNEADLNYLDLKKSAEYLGCSIDTLRNRIEDGSLPAYRFGGRLIRVKKSDLEKLFHLIPSAASK